MTLPGTDPPPDTRDRLLLERDRVCDRLRSMSLARLGAPLGRAVPLGAGGSRAAVALGCAQALADAAADLGGWPHRTVPALPAHAVGDVVAVMVNDLVAELDARGWGEHAHVCAAAVAELVGLRRSL